MASPVRRSPSPASFYDMSDDEEGEYNTIKHTTSGRGVKLLYSKSKVRQLRLSLLAQLMLTPPGLRASVALGQR